MNLTDFIKNFSEEYSVHRLEDVDSGIFKAKIKADIYLIQHAEVKRE